MAPSSGPGQAEGNAGGPATSVSVVQTCLTLDSISRLFSAWASFSIFSISSIFPMSRPLALGKEGEEWVHQGAEGAHSGGAGHSPREHRRGPSGGTGGAGHLDMSGEQAEFPPVEMLVSMLSELSRLRVS